MLKPVSLWMRCETCADEHRAPISPDDALCLVRSGFHVTVERSLDRTFAIEDYADAGCTIADTGSWVEAPPDVFIIGLKGLPGGPAALSHRHIFFGHAYKGQAGAERLLARFARGGGSLLDLEYLADSQDQRLVAFGRWAGYIGAALALLHWNARLTSPLRPTSQDRLHGALAALRESATPKVLVVGARGRCGRGACEALAVAGIEPTRWDVEETRIVDRDALLAHDIVVNTVLVTTRVRPFLTRLDILRTSRRLSVIADVTCDVASSCNALPIYDAATSWDRPTHRLHAGPPSLDIIAIDNLPSLLPRESSSDFSATLTPLLLELDAFTAPWQRCLRVYHEKSASTRSHAET
jgi:saccharopine dehydrogenase (NAD+, L-lysine forming)